MMRRFAVLGMLLCLQSFAGAGHPDFSGSWVRASQSCQPIEKPTGLYRMVVGQHDPVLQVTVHASVKGSMRALPLTYKTTGEELHYTGLDGDDFRTTMRWQSEKLVFQIVELERGKRIHSEETWTLSQDGTKLVRTKTEEGEDEHSRCTATFTKEGGKPPVTITLKADRISVAIQGQPFTNLYMGAAANKPFLYPLTTASGKRVTRGFPVDPLPGDPIDHPHQKGLWVGAEHLSNMDFWENDPSYHRPNMGRIVFKDVLEEHAGADRGEFTMLSDWVNLQGESVVTEKRKMIFYAEPADVRMFDVEVELKAKRQVTFEDHHDAVIGIRLGPAFDEKNGGRAVNAQGLQGEAHTRGQRSEWVDWQTKLEGEPVGVALMDHPGNYSWPTRWHVRAMGLLVASPFAQHNYDSAAADNSKTLEASESLHLRYRVLIHPQSTDVGAVYREFAGQ